MNVLFQCDEPYAAITGVSLTSLLENNQSAEDIHIYLIHDCVSEENQDRFRTLAQQYGRTVTFLDMRCILERLEASGAPKWAGSYAAYGRLFALGLIEEEIDRLLYLDSDTIVSADLGELYNMDMEGNVCAMAQDTLSYELYRYIGHRREEPYFNSGVILFDAAQWKRLKCEDAVFPFITAYGGQIKHPDQDTLNCVLKGKIKRLDAKYNFFVQFLTFGIDETYYVYSLDKKPLYYSQEAMAEAGRNAAVYHYSSPAKPWIKGARCALVDQWDKYLQLSPWAGMGKIERKNQPFKARLQEAISECTWPVFRKTVHKIYVHTVALAGFRSGKRKGLA